MIELFRRLLHLLAQKIKSRQLIPARFVVEKIDIVAVSGRGPEREHAARGQRLFGDNSIQNFLRVVEQLARLRADRGVIENRRVSSAQLPGVEKWRPIDVLTKFGNGRFVCAGSSEIRFWRNVIAPID